MFTNEIGKHYGVTRGYELSLSGSGQGKYFATRRQLFPGSLFGANFRIADHSTRTLDNALCAVYCDGLFGVPRDIPKPDLEASR